VGSLGLRVGVGVEICKIVPRRALPIYLFRHICCKMYRLVTMRSVTVSQTLRQTDNSMIPIADHTACSIIRKKSHCLVRWRVLRILRLTFYNQFMTCLFFFYSGKKYKSVGYMCVNGVYCRIYAVRLQFAVARANRWFAIIASAVFGPAVYRRSSQILEGIKYIGWLRDNGVSAIVVRLTGPLAFGIGKA